MTATAMPDPDGVVIAPATSADADRAVEITRQAFEAVAIEQAIEDAIGPASDLSWRDIKGAQVRREFQELTEHCFVARLGGQVVGYVTCEVEPQASRGRISNLATDPRYRGRGLGRMLIQRALDHFRGLGLRQAKIETLAHNQVGTHLYPAMGFVEIARQVHYAMRL